MTPGVFHPLGLTFFWALYGWKYERERVLDHLTWLAPKGFDYLRILGEVDWVGRSIEPCGVAGLRRQLASSSTRPMTPTGCAGR